MKSEAEGPDCEVAMPCRWGKRARAWSSLLSAWREIEMLDSRELRSGVLGDGGLSKGGETGINITPVAGRVSQHLLSKYHRCCVALIQHKVYPASIPVLCVGPLLDHTNHLFDSAHGQPLLQHATQLF